MDISPLLSPDAARLSRTSPTFTWRSAWRSFYTAGNRLSLLLWVILLSQCGTIFAQSVPAIPTGLTALPGNATVSLTWNAVSGATSYSIYRSTTSGSYGAPARTHTAASWANTGLTNGTTYYYVVRANNDTGSSGNSVEVSGTPVAPPATPTGVTAVGGTAKVTINWTPVAGAVNYDVKYSTTSGGPYSNAGLDVTGTSYTHTGRDNATTYYYVVNATNAGGNSAPSAQVSAKTIAAPVITVQPGNQAAILDWDDVPGANSYTVKVGTTSGSYPSEITGITNTYYTHTGRTNGTAYYYVVTASNSTGATSSYSNQKTVIPIGISNFIQAVSATSNATVTWNPVVGATEYHLYRSPVAGFNVNSPMVANVTSTGATSYSFANTGLTNGGNYFYMVRGANSTGEGPDSAMAQAVPMAAPTALQAIAGNDRVDLTWNAPAGATSYAVKRATSPGGTYVTLPGTVSVTTYADLDVDNGTTYYYRVYAINSTGTSDDSLEKSALPASAPSAPTNLSATAGDGSVTLSWSAITTGPSGAASYIVASSTSSSGPFTDLGGSSTTSKTVAATNGTLTYYVVRAKNAGGESGNSNAVSAVAGATLQAPANVSADAGNAQVTVRWAATGQAASYTVKRSTSPSGPFTNVQAGITGTSYVNTGLTNGTVYYFVVSATSSASVESGNSVVVRAIPGAALAAPSGLTATAGNGQVSLSWNHAPLAVKYQLKRSTNASGPFNNVGSQLTDNTTINSGLNNGITYYYVVSSFSNSEAESANSAVVSALPQAPPAVPSNFDVTPGTGSVSLDWDNVSGTGITYEVKRGPTVNGPFSTVANAANLSLSEFVDPTVQNGTTYFYLVFAKNAIGAGPEVNPLPGTPLAAPTNLVISPVSATELRLKLTFDGVAGATSYLVQRATAATGPYDAGTAFNPPNPAATGLVYNDNLGFNTNTTYHYRVYPVKSNEDGDYTPASGSGTTSLAPPSGLVATPRSGDVKLDWSDVTGATSYEVRRGLSEFGPFSAVANGANLAQSQFTDPSVQNGTTYHYVVMANTSSTTGLPSNSVLATPVAAPTNLVVSQNSPTALKLKLTFNGVAGATSYSIQRATNVTGPYDAGTAFNPSNPAATGLSYTDEVPVAGNTTYYYRVYPVRNNEQSEYAYASGSGTTRLAPPASLVATARTGEVKLDWGDVAGATSYELSRGSSNTGPFAVVANAGNLSVSEFTDPGLSNNTTYYYVVVAKNASGTGVQSNAVFATPLAAPANLTVTPATDSSALNLAFSFVPGATGYRATRSSSSGGTYTGVATTLGGTATAPTLTDSSPSSNTTYYYRVYPTKTGELGDYAYASGSGTSGPTGPAAPGSVTLGMTTTGYGIKVSWTASPTPGITKYEVSAARNGQSLGVVGTVNMPSSTLSIDYLEPSQDTNYTFSVAAYTSVGKSPASSATIRTPVLEKTTNVYNTGDLFIALAGGGPTNQPTGIQWYGGAGKVTSQKTYIKTLTRPGNMTTYGMVVDRNNSLLAAQGPANKISVYSPSGVYSNEFAVSTPYSPASYSEWHQFDGNNADFGNKIYYGNDNNIVNLADASTLAVPGPARWIAFSDNNFFTYYSSVNTNVSPPVPSVKVKEVGKSAFDVNVPEANAVAAGPNNSFYVAAGQQILRFASNGAPIGYFDMMGVDNWYSLAMGPEGSNKLYAAGYLGTTVYEFDIKSGGFTGTAILNTKDWLPITGLAVKDSATFPSVRDDFYFIDGGYAQDVQVGQTASFLIQAETQAAGSSGSLTIIEGSPSNFTFTDPAQPWRGGYSFTPTHSGLTRVTAKIGDATRTYLINAYDAGTHSIDLLADGQKGLWNTNTATLSATDTSTGLSNSPAPVTTPALAAASVAAKAVPTATPVPGEKSSPEVSSNEVDADVSNPSGESRPKSVPKALPGTKLAAGSLVANESVVPFLQLDITNAFNEKGPMHAGGTPTDLASLRSHASSQHPLPYTVTGSSGNTGLTLTNDVGGSPGYVEYFKVTNLVGRTSYASVSFLNPRFQYNAELVFLQPNSLGSIVVSETALGSGLQGFAGRSYQPFISIYRASDGKYWSGADVNDWVPQEVLLRTIPVPGTTSTQRTYSCTLSTADVPASDKRIGGPFTVKAYSVSQIQPQDLQTVTRTVN